MDSILLAHVADAITAVTGDDDYDAVAGRAAELLGKSMALRINARKFAAGKVGEDELHRAVRHAIRL